MSEIARTYISATCKVGQRDACGLEATYVIAVTGVADTSWSAEDEDRDGGVVALCEYHATTPASEWSR